MPACATSALEPVPQYGYANSKTDQPEVQASHHCRPRLRAVERVECEERAQLLPQCYCARVWQSWAQLLLRQLRVAILLGGNACLGRILPNDGETQIPSCK